MPFSSAASCARAADAANATSAIASIRRLSEPGILRDGFSMALLVLGRNGLAADGIVVVVRHDLQLGKRLVHDGRRPVRRDRSAGRIHRIGLGGPSLVI